MFIFPIKYFQYAGIRKIRIAAKNGFKWIILSFGNTEPAKVIEAQSLQVGAISGATYISKVILLAIQDALLKAAG